MNRIDTNYLHVILQGSMLAIPGYENSYKIDHDQKRVTVKGLEIGGHLVFDQDFDYSYAINFEHCSFAGNFVIHKGNFKEITFSHCRQGLYAFTVNGGSFQNFNFSGGCSIQADIKIQGGIFETLTFQGGNIFGNQTFISGCSIKTLAVMECSFEKNFSLFMAQKVDMMLVKNVKISELNFHDGDYLSVHIDGKSIIPNLKISGGRFEYLKIKTENIGELLVEKRTKNINLDIKKMIFGQLGKINGFFFGCAIGQISFEPSYIHKDAILRFLNVTIQSLSFDGLVNYGQLGFSNVDLKNKFSVSNSDLGKTSFINSDFSQVDMNFEDSRITETFFSKGNFPQQVAKDDYQQRQAFAQLKKINEAKGDYLEGNHFYAKEMNAFYRTISWRKNFWEKLNLCFNKFSNDHGQSWQRALFVVLLTTSTFFVVYLLLLDISFGSLGNSQDRAYFLKCFSYFTEFLNPVHRTDEIAKGLELHATSASRLIEGISRIFIAFAIYQLVQAFRKHGKK